MLPLGVISRALWRECVRRSLTPLASRVRDHQGKFEPASDLWSLAHDHDVLLRSMVALEIQVQHLLCKRCSLNACAQDSSICQHFRHGFACCYRMIPMAPIRVQRV